MKNKPKTYHWLGYDPKGEERASYELAGGIDKVRRARKWIAKESGGAIILGKIKAGSWIAAYEKKRAKV